MASIGNESHTAGYDTPNKLTKGNDNIKKYSITVGFAAYLMLVVVRISTKTIT